MTGVPAGIAGPPSQALALNDVVLDVSGDLHISTEHPAGRGQARQGTTIGARDADAMLSEVGRRVLGGLRAAPVSPPAVPPAQRHVNCDLVPCAALSYDDGPDARTTPQLLAILKEKNVQATFFMTGSNATANPAHRQAGRGRRAQYRQPHLQPPLSDQAVAGGGPERN